MGGPKALLEVCGRPLWRQHVVRYAPLAARTVLVVNAEVAAELPAPEGARLVVSTASTPWGSLAAALDALPEATSSRRVLITPVDILPPTLDTMQRLLGAVDGDIWAATPRHRGRGGHPVVVARHALRGLQGSGEPSLRALLNALAAHRARVEVDDARVLGDFDSPQDLPAAFA